MKRAALLLVLVLLEASFMVTAKPVSRGAVSQNTWTAKAPMHKARGGLGVAAVTGKSMPLEAPLKVETGLLMVELWARTKSTIQPQTPGLSARRCLRRDIALP
jgi:hypothetical protein